MSDTATATETSTELQMPTLWNVVILNDDFTPIDFVIALLVQLFKKTEEQALEMTLRVHEEGSAIVGTYTKDVAQSKCERAMKIAEAEDHPLRLLPQPSA